MTNLDYNELNAMLQKENAELINTTVEQYDQGYVSAIQDAAVSVLENLDKENLSRVMRYIDAWAQRKIYETV